MKLLKRNETEFTYTACAGKVERLNNGKHTGKFDLTYADPVPYSGNISTPSGQAQQTLFGIETVYSHVLLMDDPTADISEDGLIQWKGYEYVIKAVRPSLNVLAVAIQKTRELPEKEPTTNGEGNEGQQATDPSQVTEPEQPENETGEP